MRLLNIAPLNYLFFFFFFYFYVNKLILYNGCKKVRKISCRKDFIFLKISHIKTEKVIIDTLV